MENLEMSDIKTPEQETGITQHAQETGFVGVCSFNEAKNSAEKKPLSPVAPNKVWQSAKDDPHTSLFHEQVCVSVEDEPAKDDLDTRTSQEDVRLSLEEVSNTSSVVQIEPTHFPKVDPPSKSEDQEEVPDKAASQPLITQPSVQPPADGEGNAGQAPVQQRKQVLKSKKCIVAAVIFVLLAVICIVLGIYLNPSSEATDFLDGPSLNNHDPTTVHVSRSSGAKDLKYYTCIDLERCPKITHVYDNDDITLYHRGENDTIPKCCGMSSPAPGKCNLCCAKNITTIVCNQTVPNEGEDDRSKNNEHPLTLKEIPPVPLNQPCHDVPPLSVVGDPEKIQP